MITYGLCTPRGMGYGLLRTMGYGQQFSANQLGGRLKLWGKWGYGLRQVWVKRGLTVYAYFLFFFGSSRNMHFPQVGPLLRFPEYTFPLPVTSRDIIALHLKSTLIPQADWPAAPFDSLSFEIRLQYWHTAARPNDTQAWRVSDSSGCFSPKKKNLEPFEKIVLHM